MFSERFHEIFTIMLYVMIFFAPILFAEMISENLGMYFLQDRAREFLDGASDGITVSEYVQLNRAATNTGYSLKVTVTMPDNFFSDRELVESIEENELEVVPGTLVEVYLESGRLFVYDSRMYDIFSEGGLP